MRKEDYLLLITFVTITLILTKCQTIGLKKMSTLYSWDKVDYVFPTEASQKKFIPENVLMLDATVWGGHGNSGKTFVTTPRLRNGTPASLSIVTQQVRNGVNLLQPYPDWSWHNQKGCEGMTSVFRTTVDKCGRLWVLDTGFLHAENRQVCSPQILIFDLATDTLIDRHIFPKDVVTKLSLPITIIVDVLNENIPQCEDAFAYIADVTTFKLIVYDHRRTTSWRIDSHLFYPYPLEGVFNINGVQFDLMDGIFGLALGPVDVTKNNRKLYFHSLASVRESWVPTCAIRNQSLFLNGENKVPRAFKVFEGTRNSQSAAQVMSDDGVLFFGLLTQNSLACWNSKFPYSQQYIETVAQDDTELQFISGIKIDNGNVWATTSRFQQFFTGVMNFTHTNFRILYAPIKELVEGTSCAIASSPNTYLPPPTFRPFPAQQNQVKVQPEKQIACKPKRNKFFDIEANSRKVQSPNTVINC